MGCTTQRGYGRQRRSGRYGDEVARARGLDGDVSIHVANTAAETVCVQMRAERERQSPFELLVPSRPVAERRIY